MPQPLGDIFHEGIIKENKVSRISSLSEEAGFDFPIRLALFAIVAISGFLILLSRLFFLTVVEGKRYRELAKENRIREKKIPSPRGIIYDRDGTPLVRNIPVLIRADGTAVFEPVGEGDNLKGEETVTRDYIFGDMFTHILGYTGEISEEELSNARAAFSDKNEMKEELKPGDIVGKMGVEKSYDEILRGISGKELYEVDALGNKVRVLGQIEPKSGEKLTLTVDANLQQVVKNELAGKKGAVIVSVPQTGEILALFSSPSFDANSFVRGVKVEEILQNEDRPLFNRAIAGQYPPGSTFKIVTSIAALEAKAVSKETKYEDTGVLEIGEYSFGNWYYSQYGKKEGMLDIVSALKRSNDIFFYKIGEATGIETLSNFAKKMGAGQKLGIDIDGEEEGLMPDPEWLQKTKGEKWYLGNTYHVAIGQGDVLATPLQVNAWTNVIASGGKLCRPFLAKSRAVSCRNLDFDKENIDLVREGMKQACSPGGTGWPLFNFGLPFSAAEGLKQINAKIKIDNLDFFEKRESSVSAKKIVAIPVACKTGTAEFADFKKRTHAWFTVFAPVYNPQISITVLVEAGGEGSSVAAPIAKKILEHWFMR